MDDALVRQALLDALGAEAGAAPARPAGRQITYTDLYELKAALLAAKENTHLPILASMSFEAGGRTFTGCTVESYGITAAGLGADAVGINCSLGPAELRPFARAMLAVTAKPVMVQANAGLPHVEDGCTVFDIDPQSYADAVANMVEDGVGIIGGCCGTNPDYIRLLADIIANRAPQQRPAPTSFTVTGAQRLVELPQDSRRVAVIGERINPTGKNACKRPCAKTTWITSLARASASRSRAPTYSTSTSAYPASMSPA